MTAKIKTIHLLLLEPSSNHAEVIINSLRNRAFAVRATQVLTPEELSNALEKGVSDILLANTDHPDLTARQAIEQIATFGRDIPCIILSSQHNDELLLEAMNYGAKDAVAKDNLNLICLKTERELANLEVRRQKTHTELALKAAEKRCTLLLDNSQDAIAYVHDGMHVYSNNAYLKLFEYSDHDELMCVPALDMIDSKNQDEFRQYLKSISSSSDQQSFNFVGVKSDMTNFDAMMTLSTANFDDEICTQLLIRPAADNAELEEKLKELSALDAMTDLYNKTYFHTQLQNALGTANEKGSTYNVIYIEYDQYSKVRTEYGLAGIDQITTDCASWLSGVIPEEYLLARVGDHAFCLLLEDNKNQLAKSLAEKLCEKVQQQLFDIEGTTLKLTFSIGICPVGDDSSDAAQIISDAHSASNRVESNGYKIFNKAVHNAADGLDIELLETVQDAIETGRLELMYQPIVRLHGDEKALYQVLLKVNDKDGKQLDSSKIFPIAKAAGLGEKLDRWILINAIESFRQHKLDESTQLFVNLSGSSIISKNLVPFIEKTFSKANINKNNIVLQIEESDAANHLKRALVICSELKQKGYSFCLSNYGSDEEQKILIDQLDVDFVRISDEKSRVIAQEPEVAEEVQHLLDEIHNRDKLSIIPRVEEAAMLASLWPMNVKYIQGYYLQRPTTEMDYDFSSSGF
jgi:multidomain signaling protein FimX